MGKLVEFKRPGTAGGSNVASHGARIAGDPETLLEAMAHALDQMGAEPSSILRMEVFLMSLRGHVSNESIAAGQELLRGLDREELLAIAARSTKSEWQAKPGYYQALVSAIARSESHPPQA